MSSVHLPNRSILEASKVIGCDGGLHSRPELSALVTRVGGELVQVMRRRRARTCSMRSAGRRLVRRATRPREPLLTARGGAGTHVRAVRSLTSSSAVRSLCRLPTMLGALGLETEETLISVSQILP